MFSITLKEPYQSHVFFDFPIFQSPSFTKYSKDLLQVMNKTSAPAQKELEKIAPAISNRLDAIFQQNIVQQENLTKMREDVTIIQEDIVQLTSRPQPEITTTITDVKLGINKLFTAFSSIGIVDYGCF
jgi:SMC interacting uncharacterized protein involved in chromosome segregation